jgi:Flp pilus assembly protein TadD
MRRCPERSAQDAIAEYRKAIVLDPSLAAAYTALGAALNGRHETGEAIAEYKKAIELDPRDAGFRQNLAVILRAQRKTKEADAEDQKAADLGTKYSD